MAEIHSITIVQNATQSDTLVAASGIEGWDFLDEAQTANGLVSILKAEGVEAIVVLLHEGGLTDGAPRRRGRLCRNLRTDRCHQQRA